MRAVIQRVQSGSVSVDNQSIGTIAHGLVILLGICDGDTEADARYLAKKCVEMRIFSDAAGKFNLSAQDVAGQILIISQFTLYGDCRKGRRPNFTQAAHPRVAEPLYDHFADTIRSHGLVVQTGQFGANMLVTINNDGPVTIIVESK